MKISKMRTAAALAALLFTIPAFAADLPPTKAPAPVAASPYQFSNSGFWLGAYTEAGGGPVTATVPGVASASLTTTSAAIGITAGYGFKLTGQLTGTIEADVCAKNFNGANAGFSVAGPICFEQRVMVFAPRDVVLSALSFLNIPNLFGNMAAIVLPAGATISSAQWGIGGGAYWNDMTVAFNGAGANKVFSVNPELALIQQDVVILPGNNRLMLRSFEKIDFESETLLIGTRQGSAQKGVGGRIGFGVGF